MPTLAHCRPRSPQANDGSQCLLSGLDDVVAALQRLSFDLTDPLFRETHQPAHDRQAVRAALRHVEYARFRHLPDLDARAVIHETPPRGDVELEVKLAAHEWAGPLTTGAVGPAERPHDTAGIRALRILCRLVDRTPKLSE